MKTSNFAPAPGAIRICRRLAGTLLIIGLCPSLHSEQIGPWFPTNAPRRFIAYAKVLEKMNESPLYSHRLEARKASVRLLLLPSFQGNIAIHITKREEGVEATVTRTTRATRNNPYGDIISKKAFKLTSQDWANVNNAMAKAQFWAMSTVEPDPGGNDGSNWLIEASANGRYHVVDRWSPEVSTELRKLAPYRELCLELLKAAQVDERE